MRAWLVIQLAAPLASMGELAGNKWRGGRERPGKGALIGLLGVALGVRREDEEGQRALVEGYDVATRTLDAGRILQDYHTFQSLPRGKPASTRADALADRQALETSITVREYRQDVVFEAAFSARGAARWSLTELEEALRAPCFMPYFGRRACPLALPLDPRIVEADGPLQAFDRAALMRPEAWAELVSTGPAPEPQSAGVEATERERYASLGFQSQRRRDLPVDRGGWHFAEREELVVPIGTRNGDDES